MVGFVAAGCHEPAAQAPALAVQSSIEAEAFGALVDRISEPPGYFDTDNLISNETGYLKVMDSLAERELGAGAYIGVGPDQNYSYIAELDPSVAFIVDVRRDNALHHLLLKSLIEMSPTRVEFLSLLHGVEPPPEPPQWEGADIEEIVEYVDAAWEAQRLTADGAQGGDTWRETLQERVQAKVSEYGVPLSTDDLATIRRFHATFMREGLSLRFSTFGRPPRPYYPTYRQLVLETDMDGDRVSYLATPERYRTVRELHLANRIVPVVGDLAGEHAIREVGKVLGEMGTTLDVVYASNVEFYLWRSGSFDDWVANLASVPATPGSVVIRSYFSNFGRAHPSSVPGYYATQSLQPLSTLVDGGFESFWDVVTRDVVPLR